MHQIEYVDCGLKVKSLRNKRSITRRCITITDQFLHLKCFKVFGLLRFRNNFNKIFWQNRIFFPVTFPFKSVHKHSFNSHKKSLHKHIKVILLFKGDNFSYIMHFLLFLNIAGNMMTLMTGSYPVEGLGACRNSIRAATSWFLAVLQQS